MRSLLFPRKISFYNLYRHNWSTAGQKLMNATKMEPKTVPKTAPTTEPKTAPKIPHKLKEKEASAIRLQNKLKRLDTKPLENSSSIVLHIIGSGARGAPGTVYLSTDHHKYMFNCGEATQRLCYEHRFRLTKMKHIFLTSATWKNMGGLPGLILTIQDTGIPEINLHGPPGLLDFIDGIKRFVYLDKISINQSQFNPQEIFNDSVMTLFFVPIFKSKGSKTKNMTTVVPSVENLTKTTDNLSSQNPYVQSRIEIEKSLPSRELGAGDFSENELKMDKQKLISDNNAENQANSDSHKSRVENQTESEAKFCTKESLIQENFRKKENSAEPQEEYLEKGNGKRVHRIEGSDKRLKIAESDEVTGVMSYICKLKDTQGKLLLEKCVEMGVETGPNLAKLKAGESITLPDGRTVHSKDVCRPSLPGAVIIIVECPSEDYLDSFISQPAWTNHQSDSANEADKAYCVIHYTPPKIMKNPRYAEWMGKFPIECHHIIVNEDNVCLGSEAIFRYQHQLNLLEPEIFPLLNEDSLETQELDSTRHLNIHHGKSLQSLQLHPTRQFETANEIIIKPKEYLEEIKCLEGFEESLSKFHDKTKEIKSTISDNSDFPKIIMLGTGSSIPNKVRNTSGILLRLQEDESLIFDCGEGTFAQMVRFFGRKKVDRILSSVKGIFISHLHADHHIGLITILQERGKLTNEPVILLAPQVVVKWLGIYDVRFEPLQQYFIYANNHGLLKDSHHPMTDLQKAKIRDYLGVKAIETCKVKHCAFAYGISVVTRNNKKIVYSGDTMPCDSLVDLGQNCDLLIHEATMEDDLEEEAVRKLHSTVSQAIEIGHKMSAKYTLLTHFSQRYSKIPCLPSGSPENVGIAYDNMELNWGKLPLLSAVYPTLKVMFAEHHDIIEQKAQRRLRKKLRQDLK